jgi:PKD repeat protein
LIDGRCTSAEMEGYAGATFGASVESGGLVYVPVLSTGEVVVVRVAEGTVVGHYPVTAVDRPFELTVKDGTVWFNEPDGATAGVLGPDGIVASVDKYDELAVSGAIEGGQPTTPPDATSGDGTTDGTGSGGPPQVGQGRPGPQSGEGNSDAGGGDSRSVGSNGGADGPVEDVDLSGLVADFTFSKRVVEVGEKVRFVDRSQGGPVSWTWEFGDGSFATGPEAEHSWDAVGAYRVTLRIEGETGTAAASATIEVVDENTRSRPNADFRYSASRVEVGEAVTFTDRTTGNATELRWDFGDGSIAAGSTVQHAWTKPGTYKVALTATNALGSDTSPPATITVFDAVEVPTAVIAAGSTAASVNQTVQFTSRSTGNPTELQWTFGDGTSARGERVSHAWTSPGTYDVRLHVSNSAGADDATVRVVVDERVVAPEARLVASTTTAEEGQAIRFTSLSINNPTRLTWEFGDGDTDTGTTVTHAYAKAGRYTVTLKASNSAGDDEATTTVVIVADVPAPVAAFGTTPDGPLTAGTPIQFTDQSTGGAPTSWSWDFGDGTAPSALRNPTHVFAEQGRYDVRLTVENSGGRDEIRRTVDVRPPAPVPDFTFSPGTPNAGQEVQFTDTSRNVTGDTTWLWEFGDGGRSTDRNPRYTYRERGTFPVKLTVTNAAGPVSTTKSVAVNPRAPIARFTYTPGSNITTATSVRFDYVAVAGSGEPDTITWDFKDGTPTQTGRSVTHTFARSGTFNVTLTVVNQGGRDGNEQSIRVTAQPPNASFTVQQTPRLVGTPITFTNTTPSVAGVTYSWNFDDGSTSTAANPPAHTFSSARTYNVTLRATLEGVTSPVATVAVRVYPAISAGFTAPTTVDSGEPVDFDNTSTGADSYTWNFGDDTPTSGDAEPTHRFTNTGAEPRQFTVSLTARNPGGEAAPVTRTITVRAAPPVAAFTMRGSPDGTVNLEYTPTAGAGTPTTYEWDFDDGDSNPDAPNQPAVSAPFADGGRVRLVVRNSTGASAPSAWQTVPELPDLDFDWSPSVVLASADVRFTNRTPGSWANADVEWDFDENGEVDATGNSPAAVRLSGDRKIVMWINHSFWGRLRHEETVDVVLGN